MARYVITHAVHLRDKGGIDFVPAVVLYAPTQVSILGMVDPRREGIPSTDPLDPNYWYDVLVESGRHVGRQGFLHTTEFDQEVPSPERTYVEARVQGTKYGMVEVYRPPGLPDEVLVVGPWEKRCSLCNEISALHVMPSTNGGVTNTEAHAQNLLLKINASLRSNRKNSGSYLYQPQKEVMIGVLQVAGSDTVYASHSSKKFDQPFADVCAQLKYVYCPPLALPVLNRRGDTVGDASVQDFDYQCAAPRLIQHAIRLKQYPIAMTEIYGGGANQGTIIPSCGRCKKTVPYMLCPD